MKVVTVSCVISAPRYSTLLVAEARSGSGVEAESRVRGERLVAGGPLPLQSALSSLTENTRTAAAGLDTGKRLNMWIQ